MMPSSHKMSTADGGILLDESLRKYYRCYVRTSEQSICDACDVSRVAASDAVTIVRYGDGRCFSIVAIIRIVVAITDIVTIGIFVYMPLDTLSKLDARDGQPRLLTVNDDVMHRR